jgi:hypothetical protein
MQYAESILRVLVVGLILGAGLPAVFAVGLVAFSSGSGGTDTDGTTHAQNPALKFAGMLLFLLVALVIVAAILWISRATIIHYTGVDLFPGVKK